MAKKCPNCNSKNTWDGTTVRKSDGLSIYLGWKCDNCGNWFK